MHNEDDDPYRQPLHRLLVENRGILSQLSRSDALVERRPGHKLYVGWLEYRILLGAGISVPRCRDMTFSHCWKQ